MSTHNSAWQNINSTPTPPPNNTERIYANVRHFNPSISGTGFAVPIFEGDDRLHYLNGFSYQTQRQGLTIEQAGLYEADLIIVPNIGVLTDSLDEDIDTRTLSVRLNHNGIPLITAGSHATRYVEDRFIQVPSVNANVLFRADAGDLLQLNGINNVGLASFAMTTILQVQRLGE